MSTAITFADIASRVDDERARRFLTRALSSAAGDVAPLPPYGLPPPASAAPPPAPSLTVDAVKAGLPNLPLPWRGTFRAPLRLVAARRGGRGGRGGSGAGVQRGGGGPAPPAAAAAATGGVSNGGLSAFGWWLLERHAGALPQLRVPPAAALLAPAAAAASAQRAAAAAARAAGPTALPGWGDAAFPLHAPPPLRSLGLAPPAPPPPPPPRADVFAVCVRGAEEVVEERAATLGARGVALRAARARTELLRSVDFLPEAAARALLAAAEGGGAVSEGAQKRPFAATAGGGGGGCAGKSEHAERRLRLVALAQAGALPALEPLRISDVEAAALRVAAGAGAYAATGAGGEEDEDPIAACRRAVPQPALPRAPPAVARLPALRPVQMPAATLLLRRE